jgi:hypothetical protein
LIVARTTQLTPPRLVFASLRRTDRPPLGEGEAVYAGERKKRFAPRATQFDPFRRVRPGAWSKTGPKSRARRNEIREPIQGESGCPDLREKIFIFRLFRIRAISESSRAYRRDVSRSSRTLGAGCDGRRISGAILARRTMFLRTAKSCGPGAPMQVLSFSNLPRGDGDNKARSHRGEHGISRKPSRRECRRKRLTCGDLLVCFFHSHTRLRVRLAPGIPCSLVIPRDNAFSKTRA